MLRWIGRRPALSVVVVVHDMAREAPRTLHSLCAGYQRGVDPGEYEVIVVDNGSDPPLAREVVLGCGANFRHLYVADAAPSPAAAVNLGVRHARGRVIGILLDGARIVTPGLLGYALRAFRAFERPIVTALAWHLGPDIQRRAVRERGYGRAAEDELLDGIGWPRDGYRLFEIATLGGSSQGGWFVPKSESSTLFLPRATFEGIGGYDERFDIPGGGLLNTDAYVRACEHPGGELVVLLGEGSFHQIHGGAMTGASEEESRARFEHWVAQYETLRGRPPVPPQVPVHYLGHLPAQALAVLRHSVEAALAREAP